MANTENDQDYWILLLLACNDRRFGGFLKYINRASLINKLNTLINQGYVVKLIPNPNRQHNTLYRITELGRFALQRKVRDRIPEMIDEVNLLKNVEFFENVG